MKLRISFIFILLSFCSISQQLNIGVLSGKEFTTIEVGQNKGVYAIYSDTILITKIWNNQKVSIKRTNDVLTLTKEGKNLGSYDTLRFFKEDPEGSFTIQGKSPSVWKLRKYQDNLMLIPSAKGGITSINQVEISNYLAGVIESEGGGGKHIEYYKVQAILSRTYALDHLSKHRKDGYQLCDRTHCQAYHQMELYTPKIDQAVEETNGIVMINNQLQLANGFFFANCGGQTSEADFVWNVAKSYCRSIKDTFCIQSRQATWTEKIAKDKWRSYLVNEFGYPVQDSIFGPYLYAFSQPQRKAFYVHPILGIPLRDIRMNFKLKSTWFNVKEEGNYVVLHGKGFGHGVGLCQEGAMQMAKLGYNYVQILKYYFTDIRLFNYYTWLFLRQDAEAGL